MRRHQWVGTNGSLDVGEPYGVAPFRPKSHNWNGTCHTDSMRNCSEPRFASREFHQPHINECHYGGAWSAVERSHDDGCTNPPSYSTGTCTNFPPDFNHQNRQALPYHHTNSNQPHPPSPSNNSVTPESAFSCDSICEHELQLEAELVVAQKSIAELTQLVAQQQDMLRYYQHQMESWTATPCLDAFGVRQPVQQRYVPNGQVVHQQMAEYERLLKENEQLELHYRQLVDGTSPAHWERERALRDWADEMRSRKSQLLLEKTELTREFDDLKKEVGQLRRAVKRQEDTDRRQQFGNRVRSPRKRGGKRLRRFICEAEIIQNLIRSQLEFYFSAHNLRKDKQLLHRIIDGRFGFLKKEDVLNLPRIKPIGSLRKHFVAAVESSNVLVLTADDWVGCPNFTLPDGDEFPFRRSVFVCGLPRKDKDLVASVLKPFGDLLRIEFSEDLHGTELDTAISKKLLEAPFVTQLEFEEKKELVFAEATSVTQSEFGCRRCGESTRTEHGFYRKKGSNDFCVCLNCAAIRAEEQIGQFKKDAAMLERGSPQHLALMETNLGRRLGADFAEKTFTALAVFSSQRQASKCVFVRSRLPVNDIMVVHYHHYTRIKKEIALSTTCEWKTIGSVSFVHGIETARPRSTPCSVTSIEIPTPPHAQLVSNTSLASLTDSETTGPPTLVEDWESENGCSTSYSVSPRRQNELLSSHAIFPTSLKHLCHDDPNPFLDKFKVRRVMTAPVASAQQVYMQSENPNRN